MKIGILTFHYAYNYGAVLQAFALQAYLQELGHKTIFLDIRPTKYYSWSLLRNWEIKKTGIWHRILPKLFEIRKCARFDRFRKNHLILSKRYNQLDQAIACEQGLDAIIVGSDQVWNSLYGRQSWECYLLKTRNKFRRISFAACLGRDTHPAEYWSCIQESLPLFHAISVRDQFSKRQLEQNTTQTIEQVVDPTALIDWDHVFPPQPSKAKFILVFGITQHTVQTAHRIKKELNLPIWAIGLKTGSEYWHPLVDRMICDASPIDWINYIRQASILCTKSFHGTMFALYSQTPLIICGERNNPPTLRLLDVANEFHMGSRLVYPDTPDSFFESLIDPIDWSIPQRILDQKRILSKNWLIKALT